MGHIAEASQSDGNVRLGVYAVRLDPQSSYETGYIRRRIREGGFRKVNAEVAARSVLGMITYHGHVAILFPERFGLDNVGSLASQTAKIFLGGIRA